MLPEPKTVLIIGLMIIALGSLVAFRFSWIVALGARKRLAAGWTMRQIRAMSLALGIVVVSFCFAALPSAPLWLFLASITVAGGIAFRAHRWSAVGQLVLFFLIVSVPFLVLKVILIFSFPEVG